MKIKPTDSSAGLPPEPGEIDGKSAVGNPSESPPLEEAGAAGKTREVFPSAEIDALKGTSSIEELGRRFLDMALEQFKGALAPGDLGHIKDTLREYMGEDPFIQSKLERISSLLAKAR